MAQRPDFLLAVSFLALALFTFTGVIARRRVEDRVFSLAVILHLLLRSCILPLLGKPRYLLPVYPGFLTMGEWVQGIKPRLFTQLCIALFMFNLAWMTAFLKWSLVLKIRALRISPSCLLLIAESRRRELALRLSAPYSQTQQTERPTSGLNPYGGLNWRHSVGNRQGDP